ncbi:spore coat protein [Alkalihalobacillus oceani]|uniref:Spore coat protein n=1 Tax=Halalkalibacter oceani TaxID=1653776 RepID=A0A9X2DPP5_9BACI|nr:spore coat protein [Halalkalibacter oceani]MCM3713850.1 spore coat protein [Halalkalibacter oceani]
MNQMVQNMTGMGGMTEQVIATDLLISAKTAVKNCAVAITEAATPEVRNALQQELEQAVQFHGQITDYMMKKGYYHPYNMNEQYQVDMAATQATLQQVNQTDIQQ